MLKIMKIAGIKKKKVRVQNVPAKGIERLEEFDNKVLALDRKYTKYLRKIIIFCFSMNVSSKLVTLLELHILIRNRMCKYMTEHIIKPVNAFLWLSVNVMEY